MGRQYLLNCLYTRLGDRFKKWVDERVEKRHREIKEEGKKYIDLDPEMYQIFKESKAVSTSNGCAYHLMKASAVRRRTKKEIEEDKLAEAAKKLEIELKLKRFEELEASCAAMQESIKDKQHLVF